MDIGDDLAFVAGKPADLHIFTDGEDLLPQHVGNGLVRASRFAVQQGLNGSGVLLGNGFGAGVHKSDEAVVFGDEVGLGVDFDDNADFLGLVHIGVNYALSSDAARFFRSGSQAFLTQNLNCFLHIAVGFGQRLFAVHHAAAGSLAQGLYVFRCKSHVDSSNNI